MAEWAEVKAAGLASASQVLESRADAGELCKLVADWLVKIDALDKSSADNIARHPATLALVKEFEHRDLPQVAEALGLLNRKEGAIPKGRWLIARLVGVAAAERFLSSLAAGERGSTYLSGLESFGAWDTFELEVTNCLRLNVAAQSGFWNELKNLVENIRNDPGRSALKAYADSARAGADEYQKKPNASEAWETRLNCHVLFEQSFLFHFARRVEPAQFLAQLGRLPHPVFVEQCIREKPNDDLPNLIRLAPIAFDESGGFRPEGMVLLALLRAAGAECRRRAWNGHDTAQPVAEPDKAELEPALAHLQSFVDAIMNAVFERPDCVAAGWLWLERLIFEGDHRGLWRLDRNQATGWFLDPLMMLISSLSIKLEPREDAVSWIFGIDDLWRVDRMAAVLAVAAAEFREDGDHASEALVKELLRRVAPPYAGAISAIQRSDSVIGRIAALHVLGAAEPGRFIRELWDELRPIRERAWRTDIADSGNNVAEFLVLCGICALELASGDTKLMLWSSLRSILESAIQTDFQCTRSEFWPAALRRHSRSTCKILPEGDLGRRLDILSEVVRPYARANRVLFEIVFALQSSGIDLRSIELAVARWGTDSSVLARRYLKLEELGISRGRLPRYLLEQVQSFAQPNPSLPFHDGSPEQIRSSPSQG
ncbi:hypothetical protein [Rhodopseudomonas parapalustris]